MKFDTDNKIDVAFVIPHRETVTFHWAVNFARMMKPPSWQLSSNAGLTIQEAREFMVESVLNQERFDVEYKKMTKDDLVEELLDYSVKYIFFIDSDIVPPVDAFWRMTSYRYPFVSGIYYKKDKTNPVMYVKSNVRGKSTFIPVQSVTGGGWFFIDAVGAGLSLIDTRIFKRLSRPWFLWEHQRVTDQLQHIYPGMNDRMSEDIYFCNKVYEELGIKPLVDPGIVGDHIGYAKFGPYGMKAMGE